MERRDAADRGPRRSLEAPERGSADELLDAGAHAPLDAMRHSAAHVMAEAVLDLFPGTKLGIGPAIDGRLLLRLRPAAPADARRPRRDRGADARRASPPTTRSSARELPFDEGRAVVAERRASRTRSRSSTTSRRRRAAAGEPSRRSRLLRARPVHRPVQGPARRVDRRRSARSSCSSVAGAYWRGDEKRPMLQRDLRHGLGDPGGARPVPVAPRGGEEARPPPARRRSSTSSASTTSARARPSGTPRASGSGGRSRRRCASSRTGAATRRSSTPIARPPRSCGSSRATGTSTATTCSSSSPRARRSASSR